MRRSFLIKAFIGVMLFSAFGCKTKKIAQLAAIPGAISPSTTNSEIIKSLSAKQVSYNTLAIKAKADLNINNDSHDVSMSIRIKSGEVIWVSVTALAGIEVARMLLTPDSVKVLNKLQSEYTAKPFSFVHQYAGKHVDFNTIQGLFTANALPGTLSLNSAMDVNGSETQLTGNLSGLIYTLLFNSNNNLTQTLLQDELKGQALQVNYAGFGAISGKEIPFNVHINSGVGNKKVQIDLKYNQVTVNEAVEFPFNVPKRFTVKN